MKLLYICMAMNIVKKDISTRISFLVSAVMDEVVSKVESELLCRAYTHMYLGDDPFDKEAKEKFGMTLLSLF